MIGGGEERKRGEDRGRGAWRRRITACGIVALGAGSLLWTLLPPSADVVEAVYSKGLFRALASVLVPLGDLFPFSLSFATLAVLAVLFLVLLVRRASRIRREGSPRPVLRWFGQAARQLIIWGVLGYAGFLVLWGGNYQRARIEERLALEAGPVSVAELEELAVDLVALLKACSASVETPDIERSILVVSAALRRSIEEWYGLAPAVPRRIKMLPEGWLLASGTTGVTMVPFLEAHVDSALPEPFLVAVAAHELAHSAGLARESDAELASTLAALASEDDFVRYAAALSAYSRCRGQLAGEAGRRIDASLPPRAREDLDAMRSVARAHRSPRLSRLQRRVYDAYLRSQSVEEGIENYSKAVTLLIRARRQGLVHGLEREVRPADAPASSGR